MATQSSKLLDHARASADETSHDLIEAQAAYDAEVLKSDDTAAILKLDDVIAKLERIAKAKADRVKALEREAEREEKEQHKQNHAQLIDRIDGKFKTWIENGEELQKDAATFLKRYRRQIEIGGEISVAWHWSNSDTSALRLHGLGIKELLAHELYLISFVGGFEAGPNSVSLPGALCPRPLEWRLTPEKIKTFSETLRELAAYGSKTMRGGKGGVPRIAKPTAAEGKLSELLNKQAKLANDVSPAGEEAYRKVVEEVSALSLEMATAQTVAKSVKPDTRRAS
jgi:translation initiation factor 1 (eIF-1/SUI1)